VSRNVKVGLDAEVSAYVAGVKAAAKATDDLGDELAELKTKGAALEVVSRQADGAGEALDDLKTDSDRAGESLKDTAVDAGRASEAIDDVGDSARTAARHVEKLDREIDQARQELKGLVVQFAEADAASRVDLTKGVTALEAKIRDLKKNRNFLKELMPDPDDHSLWDSLTKALPDTIKGKVIAGAVAAGVSVAPLLGAAIAGAVVGGVGLGGIVGGVALAASSPEVKKRGKELGKAYFEGLKSEAEDAFAGPIMGALDQLDEWGGTALPKIGKFFDNLAPGLDDFTGSVIGAGDALLDSFVYASERSGAPMRALGNLIETTGEAVGDLIENLSDHADEGAAALDDLTVVVKGTIDAVSGLVGFLADTYEATGTFFDTLRGNLNDLRGALGLEMWPTKEARLYTKATEDLAEGQSAAARAARGHRDALVDLSTEMKAETDPVFGLLNAQKKLAEANVAAAEAVEEHGRNSKEAKAALRDLATAAIELEGKAGALGESFDGKLSPSLKATLRAAGLTEKQIKDLEQQFRDAKGAGEDFARNYKAEVSLAGMVKASKSVKQLREDIGKLRGKDLYINVHVSQHGELLFGNQASAYAEGGAIEGPGTGTSDSVPILASAGEHMWTAAEVQAAGGHQAMERMRADVLSSGSTQTSRTQVMPASATQRVVVEARQVLDLSRADATAFGQLLASTLRTKTAVRQEVKTLLAKD
jgi:hypothetical protein